MTLRIISGIFGGRQIQAPAGRKTHPMSEKMRGALFNMLGDISGLSILDAYSGSGALALESVSRGAKKVIAVEKDGKAYEIILLNSQQLGISSKKLKIAYANVSSWLKNNQEVQFDVIFCDPPYNKIHFDALHRIASFIKVGGLVAYSLPPSEQMELGDSYRIEATKKYGDGTLVIFRRLG